MKLFNYNPLSGACIGLGPTASTLIGLGVRNQWEKMREEALLVLAGNSIMGAGAGSVVLLVDCALFCFASHALQSTLKFKILHTVMASTLALLATIAAPFAGEKALQRDSNEGELIAAQWLGALVLVAGIGGITACWLLAIVGYSNCHKSLRTQPLERRTTEFPPIPPPALGIRPMADAFRGEFLISRRDIPCLLARESIKSLEGICEESSSTRFSQ